MVRPSQHLRRAGRFLLIALIFNEQAIAFQGLFSATRVSGATRTNRRACTTLSAQQNSTANGPYPSIDPQVNDQRYSASDWWHNMQSLPRSTVLREIKGPVSAIFMWSAFVSTLNLILTAKWNVQLKLSSIPHSLLVSSLALLLVFRTNSAYQRFAEGRKIWEKILSVSRNMSRMATLYRKELGNPRLNRILRLLAVFPYLLRNHVKPQIIKNETINDGVMREQGKESINGSPQQTNQVLPWSLLPPTALAKCTSALNRPLWICDALSHEINQVQYTDNFTSRERLTFLSLISKLSDAVAECERIHQTAVPLNYARHSLRSLTFWLLTLPICLVGELGLLTAPVMGAIAWIMLGVYQIGYTIEDPFQGSLRLRVLCDAIYRNVMCDHKGNLVNRKSAFEMNDEEVSEWRELPPEPELTPQQEESW